MIDDDTLHTLFEAVRKAAPAAEWSVGVSMARDGKVVVESEADDELTFRIVLGARQRAPEVMVFPDDTDWQCDCGSRFEACAHVAAVLISLKQSGADVAAMPRRDAVHARLAYRFESVGDTLHFHRILVRPDRQVPFHDSVSTWRDPDVTLIAGSVDGNVESVLTRWKSGRVPNGDIPRLLQVLQGVDGVTLDGRPIIVRGNPVLPRLRVQDAGRSFLAELIADPTIERRYRNGATIAAGELRPIDDSAGIEQWQLRELSRGRAFDDANVADLLEMIADLERQIPVDVHTKRLPSHADVAPRLIITTDDHGGQLMVTAQIVYGDPAFARVMSGRLELLGDGREIPLRDELAERRLAQRLYSTLSLESGKRVSFEGMEAVTFAARLRDFDPSGSGAKNFEIQGLAHERFQLTAPIEGVANIDDEGRASVSFSSDGCGADIATVLGAWQRGWSVAPLSDGQWAPLPTDWLQRFGPALTSLFAAKALEGDGQPAPVSALSDINALAEALDVPLPPRFERLRALIGDFSGLPSKRLPAGVQASLRPYQKIGYDWLSFHREAGMGALLADDMGLGKTLQALVSARGRTLVVAPTSVLSNWHREIEKFRPNLTVGIYHGSDRALQADVDVTITTWALLRLDIDILAEVKWDTTILDESQTMKNPESQVAQAAYRLNSSFRIALTGTPLENRLEDLWSQMRYVEPGLLHDLKMFRERYVDPVSRGETHVTAHLRERIKPFILRRLKREVAPDLPPRTELVERCELRPEERNLYDALKAATQIEVVEALSSGGGVMKALEALLRLRQAACHPALVPGHSEVTSSSKVEQLLELLETLDSEGHKTLVFSQWTGFLDLVEPHLKRQKLAFLRLDGSTRDRQAVVDGFQADDGPPVLLLSLKAGGTGLNLTAADHVILLDPWWNPAAEDQAADRAHRIGQDKPVMVHRLVAADTVEERILALQERKRDLARAAIGEGGVAMGRLTREDLLGLLAD